MTTLINFEDFWPEENRDVTPVDLAPVLDGLEDLVAVVDAPREELKRKRRNVKKGLWFRLCSNEKWYDMIPLEHPVVIYYDGELLGQQLVDCLMINQDKLYIIKPKKGFRRRKKTRDYYFVPFDDRPLTFDDFDIVPNPDYRGGK